jgi:hypothetical protein
MRSPYFSRREAPTPSIFCKAARLSALVVTMAAICSLVNTA